MTTPNIPEAAIEEYARAAYERCDRAQASEDDVYLLPWEVFPGQQEMRDACRFDLEVLVGLGWTAPHPVVTTAEELDALPAGSIVRDRYGYALQLWDSHGECGWFTPGSPVSWESGETDLPATVLHRGGDAL